MHWRRGRLFAFAIVGLLVVAGAEAARRQRDRRNIARRAVATAPAVDCNTTAPLISGTGSGLNDAGQHIVLHSPTAVGVWIAPLNTAHSVYFGYTTGGTECWSDAFPAVTNGESTQLAITDLQPDSIYTYRFIINGLHATDINGTFTTPPAVGDAFVATWAASSCTNPSDFPAQNGWSAVDAENPLLMFELGDNHYCNSSVVNTIRGCWMEQRRVPEYETAHQSMLALTTWDDHDFCCNDCSVDSAACTTPANVFPTWREFVASDYELSSGEIYHKVQYGDVDIFMLDCRGGRNANTVLSDSDPNKRMLSTGQWDWLETNLASSTATFKFIACGSTTRDFTADGWHHYNVDRARLYGLTRQVPGIVFLTGDVHNTKTERTFGLADASPSLRDWYEPMQNGYPIREIIASGLGVDNDGANDWRWYAKLDIDTTAVDPTITVTVRRYSSTLVLTDISPNEAGTDTYEYEYRVSETIRLSELQPLSTAEDEAMWSTLDAFDYADAAKLSLTTTWSICTDVFPIDYGSSVQIVSSQWANSAGNRGPRLDYNTSGQMLCGHNTFTATNFKTTTNCQLPLSTWSLVCCTFDPALSAGSRIQIYKWDNAGGSMTTCSTTGGTGPPTTVDDPSAVSLRNGQASNGFNAVINDTAWWSTALSSASVSTLMSAYIANTDRNWCDNSNVVAAWRYDGRGIDCTSTPLTATNVGYPFFVSNATAFLPIVRAKVADATLPTDGSPLSLTPGGNQIALSWPAGSDNLVVDRYIVSFEYGTTAPTSCRDGIVLSNAITTSYTHTGLTFGTDYSYRVCAADARGNLSTGITGTSTPLDGTAPTDGTAIVVTVGNTQLALDWDNATDNVGVDHYEVRMATGTQTSPADCNSGSTVTGCSDPTASNCTATGLNNMVSYAFRVCAVDAAGNMSAGLTEWDQPFTDALQWTFDGINEFATAADDEAWECDDEDRMTTLIIANVQTCTSGATCDDNIFSKGPNTNVTFDRLVEFRTGGWQARNAIGALAQFHQGGTYTNDRWVIEFVTYDGAQVDGGDAGSDANDERMDVFSTQCGSGANPSCGALSADLTTGSGACGTAPCFLGTIPATLSNQATALLAGGFDGISSFNLAGYISEAALFCSGKFTATQLTDCLLGGPTGANKMNNLLTLTKRTSGGTNCATLFAQPRAWFRFGDSDGTETDSPTGTLYNRFNIGVDMTPTNMESGDQVANNL